MCSVAQSCLTLCDPMDCSLLGASVDGILQARILEWVATFSSRESSPPRDQNCVFCIAGGFFIAEPPGYSKVYPKAFAVNYRQKCSIFREMNGKDSDKPFKVQVSDNLKIIPLRLD